LLAQPPTKSTLSQFFIEKQESFIINLRKYTKVGFRFFQELLIPIGNIQALTVTSDSKYIISAAASDDVVVLDIEAKKTIHHFQNLHKGYVSAVAVTPDDKFIVTGSQDKSIKMLSIATKQEIYHWKDVHEGIFWH